MAWLDLELVSWPLLVAFRRDTSGLGWVGKPGAVWAPGFLAKLSLVEGDSLHRLTYSHLLD